MTPTATIRARRPGRESTTPMPHLVRPGSTPSTRMGVRFSRRRTRSPAGSTDDSSARQRACGRRVRTPPRRAAAMTSSLDVEVGVDALHVVAVLERVDEAQDLARTLDVQLDLHGREEDRVGGVVLDAGLLEGRTHGTRSVASVTTSMTSPWSLTSSAPASSTASRPRPRPAPSAFGTMTTPLRENRYDTEPGSASLPPLRVNARRTSEAARFRLSVRHSTSTAMPLGP